MCPLRRCDRDLVGALIVLAVMFLAAGVFRPLMPIDETRYVTVAWEMWTRHNFSLLTLNFEPYHHKPPFLFWWINLFWSVFGVSRAAVLLALFVVSSAFVVLTQKLGEVLFPKEPAVRSAAPWLAVSAMPFVIYGTVVMFDVMMAVCVMTCLLTFLSHAQTPRVWKIILGGLLIGAGILIKGPVALLYILPPLLLYPFWRGSNAPVSSRVWYTGLLLAVLVALVPVGLWLWRVAAQSDPGFLHWLVFKQTTGRIGGTFASAHARPMTFYLMCLPLWFLPGALFPAFWRGLVARVRGAAAHLGLRFVLAATVPALIGFFLISGKQVHYLIPFLPFTVLFIAWQIGAAVKSSHIRIMAVIVVGVIVAGQGVASMSFLKKYDLSPVAAQVAAAPETPWAYVRNYQGELGFLGRLTHPVTNLPDIAHLEPWFKEHPEGLAVVRYDTEEEVKAYREILTQPYRGHWIGVFAPR